MGVKCKDFMLPFYKFDPLLNKILFGKVEKSLPKRSTCEMSHKKVANGLLQFMSDLQETILADHRCNQNQEEEDGPSL